MDILRVFSEHMRSKYRPIQVDDDGVRTILEAGHGCVPEAWGDIIEMPITAEELEAAMFKGNSKKSPVRDSVGLEFFNVLWDDIARDMRTLFTQMLRDRQLSERQKQGVIVCIPKNARPHTPEDYRPITLLNTDYKILARLIAARVRPILAEILHHSQYCGVPRNTIFDAVVTIRDSIVYAEKHNFSLQHGYHSNRTTPNLQHTSNQEQHDQCGNSTE